MFTLLVKVTAMHFFFWLTLIVHAVASVTWRLQQRQQHDCYSLRLAQLSS